MTRAALLRGVLVATLLASAGCASEHVRLAALSSEPLPTLGHPQERVQRVEDVSATVRSHVILWIPTNTRPPTLQDAVDRALQRGGGDLLVDVDVTHWWLIVPFLYGQEGWTVRGDVLRAATAP